MNPYPGLIAGSQDLNNAIPKSRDCNSYYIYIQTFIYRHRENMKQLQCIGSNLNFLCLVVVVVAVIYTWDIWTKILMVLNPANPLRNPTILRGLINSFSVCECSFVNQCSGGKTSHWFGPTVLGSNPCQGHFILINFIYL